MRPSLVQPWIFNLVMEDNVKIFLICMCSLAMLAIGCGSEDILFSSEHFRKEKTTIYVNQAATGANDGTSWGSAFNNLQTAINNAGVNTEIWVAEGTYYPSQAVSGTTSRHRSFVLRGEIKLYGGFAGNETSLEQRNISENITVLSGDIGKSGDTTDNCFRVVTARNIASLYLDGFTVTGGSNTDNDFEYGGGGSGMFINNVVGKIVNSRFEQNHVLTDQYNTKGGALYASYSSIEVRGCEFVDNSAQFGGTLASENSDLHLYNCLFNSNAATSEQYGFGGALYFENSSVWANSSVFSRNKARQGGAVYVYYSTGNPVVHFTNCVFEDNQAIDNGGAVFHSSILCIVNCTFSGNMITEPTNYLQACGIESDNWSSATTYLINSILWDRTIITGNKVDEITPLPLSDESGNCVIRDFDSTYLEAYPDIQITDPLFADTLSGDLSLQLNSSAINAGSSNAITIQLPYNGETYIIDIPKTDILGRPRDDRPDLGAYEFGS